jgi:hypothetical protein
MYNLCANGFPEKKVLLRTKCCISYFLNNGDTVELLQVELQEKQKNI